MTKEKQERSVLLEIDLPQQVSNNGELLRSLLPSGLKLLFMRFKSFEKRILENPFLS